MRTVSRTFVDGAAALALLAAAGACVTSSGTTSGEYDAGSSSRPRIDGGADPDSEGPGDVTLVGDGSADGPADAGADGNADKAVSLGNCTATAVKPVLCARTGDCVYGDYSFSCTANANGYVRRIGATLYRDGAELANTHQTYDVPSGDTIACCLAFSTGTYRTAGVRPTGTFTTHVTIETLGADGGVVVGTSPEAVSPPFTP